MPSFQADILKDGYFMRRFTAMIHVTYHDKAFVVRTY